MPAPRDCPICGRPARTPEHRPFCSPACRDRDLIAWANEVYRTPERLADVPDRPDAAETLDMPRPPLL